MPRLQLLSWRYNMSKKTLVVFLVCYRAKVQMSSPRLTPGRLENKHMWMWLLLLWEIRRLLPCVVFWPSSNVVSTSVSFLAQSQCVFLWLPTTVLNLHLCQPNLFVLQAINLLNFAWSFCSWKKQDVYRWASHHTSDVFEFHTTTIRPFSPYQPFKYKKVA